MCFTRYLNLIQKGEACQRRKQQKKKLDATFEGQKRSDTTTSVSYSSRQEGCATILISILNLSLVHRAVIQIAVSSYLSQEHRNEIGIHQMMLSKREELITI